MGATSEVFSGPLGEELRRRLERAVSEARGLLGVADPPLRRAPISMWSRL